jgi:hypothetical protein
LSTAWSSFRRLHRMKWNWQFGNVALAMQSWQLGNVDMAIEHINSQSSKTWWRTK